jgi:hypothetical protein
MHRNRTWTLDPPEWRTQRNRLLPIEGGDGSTLNLDFTKGILDPRLTFNRLSTATFVNSSGYVEYAGANLFLQSENISSTAWTDQTNASRLQVNITNPIGGPICTQVTTGGGSNAIFQEPVIQAGLPHVVRIWVRAGSATQIQIGMYINGFVTGTITKLSGPGTLDGTGFFYIYGLTEQWTQLEIKYASLPAGSVFLLYPDTAGPQPNKTVYVWGPQLNPGTTAQPYYPTTTLAYHGPRFDYDPTNIGEPKGLLIEGQAINYMLQSTTLNPHTTFNMRAISTASITDPEGTTDKARVIAADGTTNIHGRYLQVTAGTNTTITVSIFAKKNGYKYLFLADIANSRSAVRFDLDDGSSSNSSGLGFVSASATSYPNGWWRCSMVVNVAASTSYAWSYVGVPTTGATFAAVGATYTGTNTDSDGIYCYGFQVEAGSGASSYIPTGASTVQRVGDDCFMSGTNFSSWWNQSEGTAFIETAGMTKPTDLTYRAFTITQNLAVPYQIGATWIYDNSGFRITELASSATKHAVALKANDFAISNGTPTIRTGTGAFSNTYNRLQLGAYENQTAYMNGCIKKFKYYPTRLPNAQLQQLTEPDYVAPTLNLDFLSMSSHTDLINSGLTFGRLSSATFVNSSGYVQFANANCFTYSNPRLATTAWNATGTVTWNGTGGIADPIGGTNAQSITFGTAASAIFNTAGTTVVSGITHTFSVWLRAASGTTNARIGSSNTGAVLTVALTETWQRFSCQYVTNGANDGGAVYSQTGTQSAPMYVWGAQIQPGSIAGDLIETSGTRNYNTPRFNNAILTSRTNLVRQSNNFTTAPWAQKDGTHSVTLTADTAPPGFSGTATKITALNTNAGITQPLSVPVISGKTAIISFYAKSNAVTAHTCFLQQSSSLLAAVTIPTTWTRIDQTAGANAITEITLKGFIDPLDISIYGMQVEYVTSGNATAYIPTTTTQVTVNTTEPKGLLIEGLTENVCTYSQEIASANWNTTTGYTVTTNTTDLLSPAGDNKATKLVYTSGYARCIQTVTLAANSTYTMSYWVKSPMAFSFRVYDLTAAADIASSIGSIPSTTEWTRVQKTFTTGASTSSCWFYIANDGGLTAGLSAYVWGAQIELGTGASSYIPTGASKVIRTGDSGVMSNITNLKYSTQKGSIYWRGVFNKQPLSYTTLIGFQTATDQPTFETFGNALSYFTAARGAALTAGGGNEVSRTFTLNSTVRYASSVNTLVDPIVSVNLNGTAGSVNKGGNGNMYLATRFVIGRQPLTTTHEANYPSVTLEQIQYYPTTLLPHQLQALTS